MGECIVGRHFECDFGCIDGGIGGHRREGERSGALGWHVEVIHAEALERYRGCYCNDAGVGITSILAGGGDGADAGFERGNNCYPLVVANSLHGSYVAVAALPRYMGIGGTRGVDDYVDAVAPAFDQGEAVV